MAETSVTVRITDVDVGAVRLAVSSAGQPGAPLVVLLHGFPEIGYAWRHQIRSLASAGYRVVAPDQRGHGWSEAPDGVDAYRLDHLVSDVVGLLDAEGASDAVIVGHDWGTEVALATALMAPDRVRSVARLSPTAEVPDEADLDEATELQADPFGTLRRIQWAGCGGRPDDWTPGDPLPSGLPPHLSKGEFENYFRAYAKSGFVKPTHVFRNEAANKQLLEPFGAAELEVPTLVIVGDRDPAVPADDAARGKLRGPHLIEGAGHWLQQEAPEQVTDLLLAFLEDIA